MFEAGGADVREIANVSRSRARGGGGGCAGDCGRSRSRAPRKVNDRGLRITVDKVVGARFLFLSGCHYVPGYGGDGVARFSPRFRRGTTSTQHRLGRSQNDNVNVAKRTHAVGVTQKHVNTATTADLRFAYYIACLLYTSDAADE